MRKTSQVKSYKYSDAKEITRVLRPGADIFNAEGEDRVKAIFLRTFYPSIYFVLYRGVVLTTTLSPVNLDSPDNRTFRLVIKDFTNNTRWAETWR